jgi:hypothetical protein
MGVCPQHDVLFPDLTVEEHLQLYAGLKGVPPSEVAAAVRESIATVGLTEKAKVLSAALSGGMKRKLSVAIALIGKSKVVVLDGESPTCLHCVVCGLELSVPPVLAVFPCVFSLRVLAAAIASNQVIVCANDDTTRNTANGHACAVRGALSVRDRCVCTFCTMTSIRDRVPCAADVRYGSVQPSIDVADAQGRCRLQSRASPLHLCCDRR